MQRLSTAEIVAFGVVLVAVATLSHYLGYRGYVRPIMERAERIRGQIAVVRGQKTWIKSLNVRVRQSDRKVKSLAPALEELQSYLVRDESERLRVSTARDAAHKDLGGLTLTPGEVSVPVRLTFRDPVDPNEQLNKLKATFERDNPRAVFPRWTVPPTIDALRFTERVTVEGSLRDTLRFLSRIESQSLFLQVTDLKLSIPPPWGEGGPKAVLEVSALGLPAEEHGTEGN